MSTRIDFGVHRGQRTIISGYSRFNVMSCGRRFGKTTLGEILAGRVAIGDTDTGGRPVGWFSPSYKYMLDVWRDINAKLKPLISRCNVQERRIELATGGLIECWSMDSPDAGRGRKYARVIIDEAAIVKDLLTQWQECIRPTLADYEGDAFIMSTPKGHNGFWQMYRMGQDPAQPEWKSFHMTTYDNPHISGIEVDGMRSSLPEQVFQQEIMAQFVDDAGGVFRRVSEAATGKMQTGPVAGHDYVFGVDWAGSGADLTVFLVYDVTARAIAYYDRFNESNYARQLARLNNLYAMWKPELMVVERNSMGEPLVQQLVAAGLPVAIGSDGRPGFYTQINTKMRIIDALALAFERGDITIPRNQILIDELQSFEQSRVTSDGKRIYAAPAGMHDDIVMAAALAYDGGQQLRPLVYW